MSTTKVTYATSQGPRAHQEDFAVQLRIDTPHMQGWLLAILDGHRGKDTAECAARAIEEYFHPVRPETLEDDLALLVRELHELTQDLDSGSTLSIACVLESHAKVVIAILGDSPVIVLNTKSELHLSPEHNVRSNLTEREAAEARGGVFEGDYLFLNDGDNGPQYGLQLTRALGNVALNRILSRTPEIYTIDDPQWVLVASDGLFDPSHEGDIGVLCEELKMRALQRASATRLIRWATRRELRDNTTALVWSKE